MVQQQFTLIELTDDQGNTTIRLDGGGNSRLGGGGGHQGDISVTDEQGGESMHLDGGRGNLTMGGQGHNVDIRMRNAEGTWAFPFGQDTGVMRPGWCFLVVAVL
jgi:hypothetical protein